MLPFFYGGRASAVVFVPPTICAMLRATRVCNTDFAVLYRLILCDKLPKNLLEKAFAGGGFLTLEGLLEGAENLLLLAVKSGGGLDIYGKVEVAHTLRIVDVGDTLAAEGEGCAGLRACGKIKLLNAAAKCGDIDGRTEGCLNKGDRNFAMDVIAVAGEDAVRLNPYLDDKVAVWTAVSARRTLSAKDNTLHMVDAGGDADIELFVHSYIALAVAIFTRGLDYLTRSATA